MMIMMIIADAKKAISTNSLTYMRQQSQQRGSTIQRYKLSELVISLDNLRGGGGPNGSSSKALTVTHARRTINALHSTSFLVVLSTSIVAFTPLPSITRHLAESSSPLLSLTPQEQAVKTLSLISASSAAVELFLSPLVGAFLDIFGRKRPSVLLHSLITLTNILVVLHPSVHTICASRIINVLCTGFLIITTNSIIGDIFSGISNDNKTYGKDQMGAVLGRQAALISSGFLTGSLLGGKLTEYGERIAYGCAAVFSALAVLNAAFRMTDTLDLSNSSTPAAEMDWIYFRRALLEAPLSSIQLLFNYGSQMRILALLLLLQSSPIFMGDVFQVFAKEEWGLKTNEFANLVALFGILGVVSNTSLPLILKTVGLRTFSLFAIISSLFFPLTAIFSENYRHVLIAGSIGLYGGAQKVGTNTAITSLATEKGVPQGKMNGERASMVALLKIVCPVMYSALYLKGKEWNSTMNVDGRNEMSLQLIMGRFGKKMPFVVNCILGMFAFILTWQNLT